EEGEGVLWSAHRVGGFQSWIPSSARAIGSTLIAIALGAFAVWTSYHAVHSLRVVAAGGLAPESASFMALVTSLSLTIVLLVSAAIGLLYAAIVKPARLEARTRYLITDRRVLIQRGDVELHLDRTRIVDVIDTPARRGLHDIFLVLDGPPARAVAASGAFGEAGGPGPPPVLPRVTAADAVQEILRDRPSGQAYPYAA